MKAIASFSLQAKSEGGKIEEKMTNSRFGVTIVLLSVLIKSLLSNPAGSSLEHEAGKCYGGGGGGELYRVEVDP